MENNKSTILLVFSPVFGAYANGESICTDGISTEYEPKSGGIFVDLFLSMTLDLNF